MSNYWKGKNVFITGINGFIGGNLAKALLDKGAVITGLVRNRDKNTFLFFEDIADRITLIQGELVDRELLEGIIVEQQIDVIALVRFQRGIPKREDLRFVCYVAQMGCHAHRRRVLCAQPLRLMHVFFGYVAGRDMTSCRRQLPHQLTSHTGAATGDDREFAFEILHHAVIQADISRWLNPGATAITPSWSPRKRTASNPDLLGTP